MASWVFAKTLGQKGPVARHSMLGRGLSNPSSTAVWAFPKSHKSIPFAAFPKAPHVHRPPNHAFPKAPPFPTAPPSHRGEGPHSLLVGAHVEPFARPKWSPHPLGVVLLIGPIPETFAAFPRAWRPHLLHGLLQDLPPRQLQAQKLNQTPNGKKNEGCRAKRLREHEVLHPLHFATHSFYLPCSTVQAFCKATKPLQLSYDVRHKCHASLQAFSKATYSLYFSNKVCLNSKASALVKWSFSKDCLMSLMICT